MQRALGLSLLLLALPAWAGRTSHLYTDESQIVPEGTVELENWDWEETRAWVPTALPASFWIWWAPVVGVTPHLELQLPLQVIGTPDKLFLDSIEVAARYRIFARQDDDGFQPLVRVGYEQPLSEYVGPPHLNLELVSTWGSLSSWRVSANLGGRVAVPFLSNNLAPASPFTGTAALGLSAPVHPGLRLAGEVYGVFPVPAIQGAVFRPQLYAGPSLAWTHGPFWLSIGSLVGLTSDSSKFLPRIRWAVSL